MEPDGFVSGDTSVVFDGLGSSDTSSVFVVPSTVTVAESVDDEGETEIKVIS